MPRELRNIGASVRARLLDRARAERSDFQILLTRYALERLLYRLSVSAASRPLHSEGRDALRDLGRRSVPADPRSRFARFMATMAPRRSPKPSAPSVLSRSPMTA